MSESKKVYESISTKPITANLGKITGKFQNKYVAIFTYSDGGEVVIGLPNHFYIAHQTTDTYEHKTLEEA